MGKKGLLFHNSKYKEEREVIWLTTLKKKPLYDTQGIHNPHILPGYINSLKCMYLEHFLGIQ